MNEQIKECLHQIRGVLGIVGDQDTVNKAGVLEDLITQQAEQVKSLYELNMEIGRSSLEVIQQNKRFREVWGKVKSEALDNYAGKADEDITDDGKEEAYREGAQDMFTDMVYEYEQALEDKP